MAPMRTGGAKRSSWWTFKRRLALVRLLLRGTAHRATILATLQAQLGDDIWGESPTTAFRHDLQALRQEYNCRVQYQRGVGYHLVDLGELYLLDLSDDQFTTLTALASIADTLPVHVSERVADLISHLLGLLPPDRREQQVAVGESFAGPRSLIELDYAMVQRIRHAVQRQQLRFRYCAVAHAGDGVQQRVAPYGLLIRDGHLYLDADCLETDAPDMRPQRVQLRLSRIVAESVEVLSSTVPPLRLRAPTYLLRYQLAPQVARRRDLAQHFAAAAIDYHADGSATVSATITDLWHAWQTLLRYGAHCRVESPPELLAMMRETTRGMAQMYLPDEPI